MRKGIYFLTQDRQRIFLNEKKHRNTVEFLGRQKLKKTFTTYYASGFYWFLMQKELNGKNKVYFFSNEVKNNKCIYAIANAEIKFKIKMFNRINLFYYQLRAFFKRTFQKIFNKRK